MFKHFLVSIVSGFAILFPFLSNVTYGSIPVETNIDTTKADYKDISANYLANFDKATEKVQIKLNDIGLEDIDVKAIVEDGNIASVMADPAMSNIQKNNLIALILSAHLETVNILNKATSFAYNAAAMQNPFGSTSSNSFVNVKESIDENSELKQKVAELAKKIEKINKINTLLVGMKNISMPEKVDNDYFTVCNQHLPGIPVPTAPNMADMIDIDLSLPIDMIVPELIALDSINDLKDLEFSNVEELEINPDTDDKLTTEEKLDIYKKGIIPASIFDTPQTGIGIVSLVSRYSAEIGDQKDKNFNNWLMDKKLEAIKSYNQELQNFFKTIETRQVEDYFIQQYDKLINNYKNQLPRTQ